MKYPSTASQVKEAAGESFGGGGVTVGERDSSPGPHLDAH